MGGKSNDANQSRHANGRERLAHHLNLVGAFVSAGCGVRLTAIAKPERDAEAIRKTAASRKRRIDCFSQDIIGTAAPIARPRKAVCSDRRLTPARNGPYASSVKRTRLIAGVARN
jgi:hypothetical protein